MDGKPTLFVELNFTNQSSRHQAEFMVHGFQLGELIEENPGTGFILVIDPTDQSVEAKLTEKPEAV